MKIEFTSSPDEEEINFLTQKINEETPDKKGASSYAFFIRNKERIIAGCNGSLLYGALYIDQLWVDPDYRKQGLARDLIERAHQYGREMGCTFATLNTLSFQNARKFYEKLGYECDFERSGHVDGSKLFFLKKPL